VKKWIDKKMHTNVCEKKKRKDGYKKEERKL
jgi:hypothetical protein